MTLRLFWRRFHLWTGLLSGLFVLVLTLSGATLMFAPEIDQKVHPQLYAVTGSSVAQPLDTYLARAKAEVPDGQPAQIRWPSGEGPLTVWMRLKTPSEGQGQRAEGQRGGETPRQRPRMSVVYMDPPSANVLGQADPRASLTWTIHMIHADLLTPGVGRSVVGVIGAGLLILSLSGIYLWWPRNASFMRGLGWRRGPTVAINLHHRLGFWIALPLLVMSVTGLFQSFPQPSRALVGFFAPFNPQPRQGTMAPMQRPNLSPQQALDAALAAEPGAHPSQLAMPNDMNKAWRIQLATQGGDDKTLMIDDATAAVTPPPVFKGDAVESFLRELHGGRDNGLVWEIIVLCVGFVPPVLAVTGVMMWLKRRKNAAALARRTPPPAPGTPKQVPAE